MNNNYISLHNHNEFSYLDGIGTASQYISKAKELNMSAIALTNHGNVDGVLSWQIECDKQNIKPILGSELYIVEDANIKKKEKRGHIVILVKNQTGWTELCRLLTKANLDGFYHRPRIGFSDLLSADLSGFVILTACIASFINLPGGLDLLLELHDKMPDRLFLEIEPHDFKEQYTHNEKILELHNELNIPLVATNDCHYIDEDDWKTQEVLLAIGTKAKWNDKKRFKFSIKGLHLRSMREMQLAFRKHCFTTAQINEAMGNTIKIAKMCNDFRIPKQEISLPSPNDSPDNLHDTLTLDKLCWARIDEDKLNKDYQNRYLHEFRLIKKKKFARYFLIFYDIIQWCKKENIPVGPGRGSVGGSLIAYLIGITKVDPIQFHLSFARFITDDRIDYPDIDVDFAKKDRERVREYIINKYGLNYTCSISTDMRLKSRAAIQAVARVFGVPEKDIRTFSKSIWQKESEEKNLQRAIDETDEGKYFAKKYPKVVHFALKLENQIRGSGQHAAALIISKEDLTKGTKCVLVRRGNRIVCNWNMEGSEYCGLMKLDILGLSTLSVLDECVRLINEGG